MPSSRSKLGIIAGSGDLPRMLANGCRKQGREFFMLAFEGETHPRTVELAPHCWINLSRVGDAIKRLRDEGVEELVMAGRVGRPKLSDLRPDMVTAKLLAHIKSARRTGDDALLSIIISFLEKQGFRVVGVQDVLDDIVARSGVMGKIKPSKQALEDIALGAKTVRHMGDLDIGQAVVVQNGRVLAVEAAEGTDGMLSRVKPLRVDDEGGVLLKAKKPGQEERVDMPAIGPDTVDKVVEAGLAGIAIESGNVLVIDVNMVAERADYYGIFLYGFDEGEA